MRNHGLPSDVTQSEIDGPPIEPREVEFEYELDRQTLVNGCPVDWSYTVWVTASRDIRGEVTIVVLDEDGAELDPTPAIERAVDAKLWEA